MRLSRLLPLVALAGLGLGAGRPPNVPFVVHPIDNGASETAAVFDVDGDGRLDIVSGDFWYQAPAWTPHRFRELNYTSHYVDAFADLPIDVDGDGRTDLVTVSWFAKRIAWYRNPGKAGTMWADADVDTGFSVEFAILADLDNDGRAREVLPQFGDAKAPLAWYEVKNGAWVKHVAAPGSFGHGIGAGDVNGDGRTDILTPKGWLEAPADPRRSGWTHHADWTDAQQLGFLHTIDLTGDGRAEVLTMAGHDYGVHYYERGADTAGADGPWTRRLIDDAWSQAHASTLVDLDADGRLDLVTGKRFMAHNGKDPGEKEPLGLYWYQWRPDAKGRPEWIRHVIHYGGQIGGGMQIPAVDIDGDGDVDLVCPGKSGLYLLENRSKKKPQPR